VAVLVLASCSDGSDDSGSAATSAPATSPSASDEVVPALAGRIEASYADLALAIDELGVAVGDLCAADGASDADPRDRLAVAQEAWRSATAAYSRTRPGAVGPAMERRLMSAVHFPARAGAIEDLLAGTEALTPEALDDQGAAVRGLAAAEVALFAEGSASLGTPAGTRRCEYLTSITDLAAAAAQEVADDWSTHEGEGFPSMGDDADEVAELLNEVVNRVRELDEKGLRDLAAADSLDDVPDGRLDGPGSYAMAERRALMDGVADLIGVDEPGLAALVADRSADTAERLEVATAEAAEAMGALADSVAESFEQPDEVQAAADALAELKVILATEVASQLGVTITFSDSDGDS
jgi:predicted lipoprotein